MDERCGAPLTAYVKGGRLTTEDAIGIALDVGQALEQLHELGERHGAVTLDNIVADQSGGWCLRDYGECFAGEAPNRESSRRSSSDGTVSGRDLWVDLLG